MLAPHPCNSLSQAPASAAPMPSRLDCPCAGPCGRCPTQWRPPPAATAHNPTTHNLTHSSCCYAPPPCPAHLVPERQHCRLQRQPVALEARQGRRRLQRLRLKLRRHAAPGRGGGQRKRRRQHGRGGLRSSRRRALATSLACSAQDRFRGEFLAKPNNCLGTTRILHTRTTSQRARVALARHTATRYLWCI